MELIRAMKPWASANEAVPIEPFRTVVAGGGTVVGSGVIVTIRTFRGYSNLDANLSLGCFGSGSHGADSSNSSERQKYKFAHKFTSRLSEHFPGRRTFTARMTRARVE